MMDPKTNNRAPTPINEGTGSTKSRDQPKASLFIIWTKIQPIIEPNDRPKKTPIKVSKFDSTKTMPWICFLEKLNNFIAEISLRRSNIRENNIVPKPPQETIIPINFKA